jgi:hypothetical protein
MEGNMAQISNNTLAVLLIVAVLISIASLVNILTLAPVPQYTGVATGKTNLTIESMVSIKMLRNESLFGAGYPNGQGDDILYIWSNNTAANWDGTAGTGSFNNGSEGNGTDYQTGTHVYPFVVENNGNDPNTCLRISGPTAATFIGGGVGPLADPEFKWAGKYNESAWSGAPRDPCQDGTFATGWTEMTGTSTTICNKFNHTGTHDEIRIHFRLGVPEDATGGKEASVTISGCNPCGTC